VSSSAAARRAINVPFPSGDQGPGSAILTGAVSALLALDVRVNRAGYHLIGAARHMLVDHRGPLTIVAHARHQVPQACAAGGRELVPSVPQVVKMQARHTNGRYRLWPCGHLVEVTATDRATLRTWEYQRARLVLGVDREMRSQVGDDRRGDADDSPTGLRLRRTQQHLTG